LQDTTDWSTVKLKDGMLIMMMGTKAEDQLAAAPKEAVKFVEDMDMDAAPAIVCLCGQQTDTTRCLC
jgi:hypothetical protein